jgi:hypothetical protein
MLFPSLVAAGCAVAGGVVFAVDPETPGHYPTCPFLALTGWYCPGCGTTRALHALLHGNVAQAFAYNSVAFIAVPVLAWSLVRSLRDWQRGPRAEPAGLRHNPAVPPALVLLLLVAYWVLRNIPAYPFSLLAPHQI